MTHTSLLQLAFISIVISCLFFIPATPSHAASIVLQSQATSISIGDTVALDIVLDTEGEAVAGVDIFYLRYDSEFFDVVDADAMQAGTQVKAGEIFPLTVANGVDTENDRIFFSQVTQGGETVVGEGTLVTVILRAKKKGNTEITLDHTPGATNDTNVSLDGRDVLRSVSNIRLKIQQQAQNAPSPAASPTEDTSSSSVLAATGVSLGLTSYDGQSNEEKSESAAGTSSVFSRIVQRVAVLGRSVLRVFGW